MTWNDDNVQWGAEQQWGFYATNLTSAPLKRRVASALQAATRVSPVHWTFQSRKLQSVEAFFGTNAIVEYHKKIKKTAGI